jgi:hypothetical protein
MADVASLLEGGVEGSLVVFLLVLSYKLYKMKITSESKCCDGFKLRTSNSGGQEINV